MRKIFCPTTGQPEWANAMKDSERTNVYRCTKCGALTTASGSGK